MSKTPKDRRPHYECDHKTTICRDCDGSAPATNPWRTFITAVK